MKINLRNYILIFCFLDIIKTSNEWKNPNKKNETKSLKKFNKKKNLQYIHYEINIFEFTLYNNQLDLIIYYTPQTPNDITFNLTLKVRTYNDTYENLDYPTIQVKINANNVTNKYTLYFDNLIENILEFTEITLYDTSANYYSYYISRPKTQLNIIYFNNENTYIIYITDISYFNYNLNLITYCNPKPSENINLIVAFYIEEYDEKGYHISSYEKEVKKIIDDISNIFISIIEIPKPSGYKLISISKVNIESNNGNNIYYIYFPNSTMHVNKDTSEYFVTYPTIQSISISKEYYINIDDFSLSGKKLNFSISCNPTLQYNIFLLLSIQIEKYNSSGNSIFENTGMKLLLNSNSNKFNLISEELNIWDNCRISISNAYLQYND